MNYAWKLKRGFWKLWYFFSRKLDCQVVRSFYGLRFSSNYNDSTFKYYVTGKYGPKYADHLQKVDTKFYFFDIGANQGLYTLCAAKNKNLIHAYAIEPLTPIFDKLEENIRLNFCFDKVSIFNRGVGAIQGDAFISYKESHSGKAKILPPGSSDYGSALKIQLVDHVFFDNLVLGQTIPIYIKVDVEGMELEVIEEIFRSNISQRIKEVFYECVEGRGQCDELGYFLKKRGFRLVPFGSGSHYDVLAVRDIAMS
mgnify:FL=1